MTVPERTNTRCCVFCGRQFITSDPHALFCSVAHMRRELEAIRVLERTTPPGVAS